MSDDTINPCGGCGERDPEKRCIGCGHIFLSRAAAAAGRAAAPAPAEPCKYPACDCDQDHACGPAPAESAEIPQPFAEESKLIAGQIASWRREIARLTDLVQFASGGQPSPPAPEGVDAPIRYGAAMIAIDWKNDADLYVKEVDMRTFGAQQRQEGRRDAHETNITLLGENCKLSEEVARLRAALAARQVGAPTEPKDHNVRQLVNDLREIALKFHGAGQLRERISGAVQQFLVAHKARQVGAPDTVRDALTTLRHWFETQRKVISKGGGSSWDIGQCIEQIELIDAAIAQGKAS